MKNTALKSDKQEIENLNYTVTFKENLGVGLSGWGGWGDKRA